MCRCPKESPDDFADPGATPLGQPNMDVDHDGDSNKKMRTGAPQNPEDVQSMISGISNDMLLMMLAQVKGRRKNDNRLKKEELRLHVRVDRTGSTKTVRKVSKCFFPPSLRFSSEQRF